MTRIILLLSLFLFSCSESTQKKSPNITDVKSEYVLIVQHDMPFYEKEINIHKIMEPITYLHYLIKKYKYKNKKYT